VPDGYPGDSRRDARLGDEVAGFLLNRMAYSLAVILAAATAVFIMIHLSGDPTAGFTAPGASPEQQQIVRERFGLDRSLPEQYLTFLRRAATGDFGESWRARRPASDAVLERLPATLRLAGAAIVLALAIGLPLGILAGERPGGVRDLAASLLAVTGQAIPTFFLGTVLILLFAVRLKWLPSSGGDGWRAVVLPAVALALYPAAIVARLIRGSLREVLASDFIRTAAGKGLSRRSIVTGHALRNAALPTLAYVGLQIGFLLGGAVIVEGVFAYPGIGLLALNAVEDRDLPVVQATAILVAGMIVIVNFAVDLLARTIDPRLRLSAAGGAG
jgi:peptide/nickel transport system permease protein